MYRLMGKYKNEEWQEVETYNPDPYLSQVEIETQKENLLTEYRKTFERSYMFKWEKEREMVAA